MKVKVQQDNEEINLIGEISLIGGIFNNMKIFKMVDFTQMTKGNTGKIKHGGILKTIAGLFAHGKNNYEFSRCTSLREMSIAPNQGRFCRYTNKLVASCT